MILINKFKDDVLNNLEEVLITADDIGVELTLYEVEILSNLLTSYINHRFEQLEK